MFFTDGTEKITPGPYKIEFRKEFLKKLLEAQNKVRKDGPDPTMSLILEDEIKKIQQIWRVEQGDWENSVYAIYREITGVDFSEKQKRGSWRDLPKWNKTFLMTYVRKMTFQNCLSQNCFMQNLIHRE